MVFKCTICSKLFLFKKPIKGTTACTSCFEKQEQQEKEKQKQRLKEHLLKKKKRKEENKKIADERLKKELQKEKQKQKEESRKKIVTKKTTESEKNKNQKNNSQIKTKPIVVSLEKQAEEESKINDSVLYVYVDVKHVRAVEWKGGKKRVALNKEREIRRTHAGGFSQEKFQRFIDAKKKKTAEWACNLLSRGGVLRGPYQEIIVDCEDSITKDKVLQVIKEIN